MWTTKEEMPINPHEWQSIDRKIARAIEANHQSNNRPDDGWRVTYWLRKWGIVGIFVTLVLFLAGTVVTLGIVAFNRVEANAKFQTNTEDRLKAIEASLLGLRASQSGNNPTNARSQKEAKQVLAEAVHDSIPLMANVIEQTGKRFVDAAPASPEAWDVAIQFAAYRTRLNSPYKPSLLSHVLSEWTNFHLHSDPNEAPQMSRSNAGVPMDQAAQLDFIGENSNAAVKIGPALLFLRGGVTSLDNMRMRHIVFEDVEVHYSGAPAMLEDVLFIDCRFVVDNSDPGRRLLAALLSNVHVTFQT